MTGAGDSTVGNFRVPKYGKDHLTLADWRTGCLRHQQPRDRHGNLPETLTAGFNRPDAAAQQVVLERGAASEFPTAGDEDVILGLIYLTAQQGFPDIVRFVPRQLMQVIRWPLKQQSYARLRRALERYKKLTATFTGNWYDRQSKQVVPTLMTGIIAQAEVITSRGRLAAGAEPMSHIQWTENFGTSLREGNLIDLDLELLFSWKRPGTKELHRHLNKVWHGGRKPRPYARDLKEIACGHLGMKDCKDLKRNFHNLVLEMEKRGYLFPMSLKERYEKKGVGVWRVQLELHSHHFRKGRQDATSVQPSDKAYDASRIVQAYHRYRFDRENYQPQPHELQKAALLLESHALDAILAVTRPVGEKVRAQSRGDLYFGFALPYFEAALQHTKSFAGFRQQLDQSQADAITQQRQLLADRSERNQQRSERLGIWSALSPQQQETLLQQAVRRATSKAVARRLSNSDLTNPPNEVLAEIEHSPEHRVGEC